MPEPFTNHTHVPNGLRALNENGQMVCAICGRGYDPSPTRQILDERRQDVAFQERLQRRIREDEAILRRLANDQMLVPCPSKTLGVLGFTEPTVIPCGLAAGHDGWHTYTIAWGEQSATPPSDADPLGSGEGQS